MTAAVAEPKPTLMDALKRLVGHHEIKAAEAMPKSLAGTKISDEERIL